MPQQLTIKAKDGSLKNIQVLRCWQDISGKQVFLHLNGSYAYKDLTPLRSAGEFDIIADPRQKAQALAWWKRAGEAQSKAYYNEQETAALDQTGDFQPEPARAGTEMDAVLYFRRPIGRRKGAVSAPKSWMEWFGTRPDWWGQARSVDFADYRYEMIEPPAGASNETGEA
jgi:hypothetical protein